MAKYSCSICGRAQDYAGALPPLYPFCSDRCKLVDLGKWLRGDYFIERPLTDEDLADAPTDSSATPRDWPRRG